MWPWRLNGNILAGLGDDSIGRPVRETDQIVVQTKSSVCPTVELLNRVFHETL